MNSIDLRSDTVTQPTPAMRTAMAEAEVGDDVYGEDPTVGRLETLAAEMLGTEAALFTPSGTQANLLALLTHCARGDEYITGQDAHTYLYEGGGAAVLGSIQPQPLAFEEDGTLNLDQVARMIKPDDFHFARTRLLCLENTQAGRPLPTDYVSRVATFARAHRLHTHLDGARIFNAAIQREVPVQELTRHFDSVSCCLSKGLGAPVGSLLCAGRDQIHQARRWRKMLGGGMRQAGVLAAAGIHALEHHVDRLAEDHALAILLEQQLSDIEELGQRIRGSATNMVFIEADQTETEALAAFLARHHILILDETPIRLVTHMDIREEDIHRVTAAFQSFYTAKQA